MVIRVLYFAIIRSQNGFIIAILRGWFYFLNISRLFCIRKFQRWFMLAIFSDGFISH